MDGGGSVAHLRDVRCLRGLRFPRMAFQKFQYAFFFAFYFRIFLYLLNAAFLALCSRLYFGYDSVAQVIASSTLVYYFPAIEESGILLCESCKEEIAQRLKSDVISCATSKAI